MTRKLEKKKANEEEKVGGSGSGSGWEVRRGKWPGLRSPEMGGKLGQKIGAETGGKEKQNWRRIEGSSGNERVWHGMVRSRRAWVGRGSGCSG